MLPLVLSLLLREVEREIGGSRARPGLSIDLAILIEDEEERREVKQMKSSLLGVVQLVLGVVL